jgi:hypothetical protein
MGYIGLELEARLLKTSKNISLYEYGGAIYEFVFHHGSHQAVDEWLEEVALINALYSPGDTVRYIVNTSKMIGEEIPILYVFRRSQEFVRAYPNRPKTRTLTFHIQVENNALLSILNIFSTWLSSHQQESALFLPVNKEAEGMDWLLHG